MSNEFDSITTSQLDGNLPINENLRDVYDDIRLGRGISHIGIDCEDEDSYYEDLGEEDHKYSWE